MKNFLKKWRDEGYNLNFGSYQIASFLNREKFDEELLKILDIGLGKGRDLKIASDVFSDKTLLLYGIGEKKIDGVNVVELDLESQRLPYDNNYFHITLCNQVYEHLKNWLWVFHEQARVTKLNGYLIIGFPNLAALHCRIQLMLGEQPSCLKIDDAHVRGFTKADFLRVINNIDGLEVVSFSGANMYGFPPTLAKKLAYLFPNISVSLFFLIRKTKNEIDVIRFWRESNLQTNYYTGLN